MSERWPALPADEWADTLEVFHLWTQVVGKIRMARGPWLNHAWGVTLYVSPRGLATGLVPYGDDVFEIRFDLIDHQLLIETSSGARERVELRGCSIADFHQAVLDAMEFVGMPVRIHPMPSEIADAVRFDEDRQPRRYVPEHAHLMWRAWLASERVMTAFRARYLGKSSPVHLYWGGFDLAVYRFSGRTAPPHPGGAPHFPLDVAQESYSHELSGAGLWFGSRAVPEPVFFAYTYPEPDGIAGAPLQPATAAWSASGGSFSLPYEAVRTADDPDAALMAFLQSTYEAGANLAGWDRSVLEAKPPLGPEWWRERPHERD